MKKLILFLCLICLSFFSCTEDDICGTVEKTYIEVGTQYNNYTTTYYFWIDGQKKPVDASTWVNYGVGDEVCITY